MRPIVAAALLCCAFFSAANLFAQQGNGGVSGVVEDGTKALIPGVTVTLTNVQTGVASTRLTNEAGVYDFPTVQPGTYRISATLSGFKTSSADNLQVGTNAKVTWNFTLEVGSVAQQVEVSISADELLTETTSSVGVQLSQQKVADLPLVGQNILDLLNVLPGFRASAAGDSQSTVGGLNLDSVNTTVNGLSSNSSRDSAALWGRQVLTTNVINPDLVGEIRLILSPVDAELGRGNGQIQILTRSGTNKYNGSAVWNVQNTALNSNTWTNNHTIVNGKATPLDWYNLNQITASYGGPIVKNKTFFFALFDKQMVSRRVLSSTVVPTDAARNGIFRYWEGWNPAPAGTPSPTSFTNNGTQTIASVDLSGNPAAPGFNPTGGGYALGGLRCFSLFGNVKVDGTAFTQSDCPGGTAVFNNGPWDPYRSTVDTTGYLKKILGLMPHPNLFYDTRGTTSGIDGLNTAFYRYLQHRAGSSATNSSIGVVAGPADYNNRNQINIKIDHNFNSKHKVGVNWTYERTHGEAQLAAWDAVLNGENARRPQFVTVNATSTLSPALINEARFGLNYSTEYASSSWDNLDEPGTTAKAREFLLYGGTNPKNSKKYPIFMNLGTGWNGFMGSGFDFANHSPLWDYADTIRWTHGKHAISAGGEYRLPSTTGWNGSAYTNASIGNASTTATPQFFIAGGTGGAAQLPNFLTTTRGNAGTLLNTLYGGINAPSTTYWIDGYSDITKGTWVDATTAVNSLQSADPYGHQSRTQLGREYSFFVKDDYKIHRRVTLNIGIRWDFVASPYFDGGLTNRFVDDGLGLFGASRVPGVDPFSTWLTPGNLYLTGYGQNATNPLQCAKGVANPNGIPTSNCDPSLMSTILFVGPGTNNPDKSLVPQSGRWSPAIGFAWQLPWFGDGKTTIRGGFQRTFGQAGSVFSGGLVSGPGADGSTATNTNDPKIQAILGTRALNLTDLPGLVPAPPSRQPGIRTILVGSRSFNANYGMFASDWSTPYTDNFTLSIQRSLRRNMVLELRNVNTLGRGLSQGGPFSSPGTFDLNIANVYHNPELFKALENTRAGIDDPLFDQMLMGLTFVPGAGAIGTVPTGGVLQRGSSQLRRSTATATALANGNYASVVNALIAANTTTGLEPLPIDPATGATLVTQQRVLRNGCDRLADGKTTGFTDPNSGAGILPRCFPENYFVTNPQVSTAEYAKNLGYSDYNAFEAQFTLRPTHGISTQVTYSYSKTMALPGSGYTDPLNPNLDYGMTLSSLGHDFRANGTVELPIGPNKLLMPNSSGWLARTLERWQVGFIYQVSQGSPRSFQSPNMLYANGRPNIVGPWDNPQGSVSWNGNTGYFFGDTKFSTYKDPQCANVTTKDNLQANCTLVGLAQVVPQGTANAVPLTNGTFGVPLLENAQPGHQGNLGSYTLHTFPRWALDGNLSKTFRIDESKSVQLRFDATNILNHPTPLDPVGLANLGNSFVDNNGNTFGTITGKGTQSRTFQGKLRFSF